MPLRARASAYAAAFSTAVSASAQQAGHNVSRGSRIAARTAVQLPGRLWRYLGASRAYYYKHPAAARKELLCGLTIAVLQIPESVAFSYVAGVEPIVGLRATVVMAIVGGLLGAVPGTVAGAAGAMAVILAPYTAPGGTWRENRTDDEINALVYMTLILTGAFQVALASLGLARFCRLIPAVAMIGFLNGLAVIILQSQLDAFKECDGGDQPYENCARTDTLEWMTASDGHTWMVVLESLMAAAIVAFFPMWKKAARLIPAGLVALVVVSAFEHGINRTLIHLPARTIKETGGLKGVFVAPDIPSLPSGAPWGEIAQVAAIMAVVGTVEAVLTSEVVAAILQISTSPFAPTQETLAQGVANFLSGVLGGMGGTGMIGQSSVNALNGGKGRLGTTTAGVVLAFFVLVASEAIGLVPVACLSGILFVIVGKTFHWPTFLLLFKLDWPDAVGITLVTVLAVTTNLAIAVGAGIVWQALVYADATGQRMRVLTGWEKPGEGKEKEKETLAGSSNEAVEASSPSAASPDHWVARPLAVDGAQYTVWELEDSTTAQDALIRVYRVHGVLFFGSAAAFRAIVRPLEDPEHAVLDFSAGEIADFSGASTVSTVCERYRNLGKRVTLRGLNALSLRHLRREASLTAELAEWNEDGPEALQNGEKDRGEEGDADDLRVASPQESVV